MRTDHDFQHSKTKMATVVKFLTTTTSTADEPPIMRPTSTFIIDLTVAFLDLRTLCMLLCCSS
jgi:hypothetical protein